MEDQKKKDKGKKGVRKEKVRPCKVRIVFVLSECAEH